MWLLMAWASAPDVVIRDDHSVRGTALLATDATTARARLADPAWIASVDASGNRIELAAGAGDCKRVKTESPHPIRTVRYEVERCPTADGFVETLIASDAFDAYEARWSIASEPGGARITYTLATRTSLLVPQFVIDRQTRKGVERMLGALQAAFDQDSL